jgi:soluble P-type ATPase
MIQLSIPGFGDLELANLVIDYNGTLAQDGKLLPGAREILHTAAKDLNIQVLTADTFGLAATQLAGLPVTLTVLPPENQSEAKRAFLAGLGASSTVAIGNGRNDRDMLADSALGIAVIQGEGAAAAAIAAADIIAATILDAFDLLNHPKRIIATLRS